MQGLQIHRRDHLCGTASPRNLRGRNLALEGNLCACRCRRPPELVASQQASYQTLDGLGVGMSPGATAHPAPQGTDGSTGRATVHDSPWLGFRLDEAASCEGVSCRVVFDDGTHAWAACMTGNRMRLHGVAARHAVRVDYLLEQTDAAPSLTALLLERITT